MRASGNTVLSPSPGFIGGASKEWSQWSLVANLLPTTTKTFASSKRGSQ